MDIGSSFSASAISEDNLVSQMAAAGRRIAFAGDDTWMQLFNKSQFVDARPYPSFNVQDLHTVDDGVWQVKPPTSPPFPGRPTVKARCEAAQHPDCCVNLASPTPC